MDLSVAVRHPDHLRGTIARNDDDLTSRKRSSVIAGKANNKRIPNIARRYGSPLEKAIKHVNNYHTNNAETAAILDPPNRLS